MKTILTVILTLIVSISQAQPTLEGLLLRIQTMENTSMTIVDYNKIVDSIANRRDILLKKELQDWSNSGLRILRGEMNRLDTLRVTQYAKLQETNLTNYSLFQIKTADLFLQLESTKLNLQNIIKALNAIQ